MTISLVAAAAADIEVKASTNAVKILLVDTSLQSVRMCTGAYWTMHDNKRF